MLLPSNLPAPARAGLVDAGAPRLACLPTNPSPSGPLSLSPPQGTFLSLHVHVLSPIMRGGIMLSPPSADTALRFSLRAVCTGRQEKERAAFSAIPFLGFPALWLGDTPPPKDTAGDGAPQTHLDSQKPFCWCSVTLDKSILPLSRLETARCSQCVALLWPLIPVTSVA